ncbi:hypothetical protein FHX74_000531 [Friedmanniella endophytica]|uniref:Pyrrolidone-carboxylate peptidase (N-terminal pyroglutamyl peptidase) n=1 Tax=Microlunatus kandeliicorticis TaxID=1759536 RepID=A0A7W3IPM5_9ACTN|nr:hypothetical protein [Microlunatus kandeliicorticis]MBA8792937.1 hypothetical protein [Microlunatus kandeliicorticis]
MASTVEESRLSLRLGGGGSAPFATALLQASGWDRLVDDALERITACESLDELFEVVDDAGRCCWNDAVRRARADEATAWDGLDDRPLYWARLSVGAALRRLETPPLDRQQREALLHRWDRTTRGIDRPLWPDRSDAEVLIMVSGFDVFGLDTSLRHSNPSGAAALRLDGALLETPHGTARVRSVVLPVSWGAFDQGVVEDAFGPVLRPGPDRADLIMTISMTGRGRMDVEKWAGNARGGSPDNERAQRFGAVSRASHWPQPFDSPEWIETTLPYAAMIAAGSGPWPVALRDGIREWPAGTLPDPRALRDRPDPSPGSSAAAGTGGDYLSNESMYRANRLRQGLQAWDVPGGHLHVSALAYPDDPTVITDGAFEADRRAVVDQTVALVRAAAGAVGRRRR